MRAKIRLGHDWSWDGIRMIIMHPDFDDASGEYRFVMPTMEEGMMNYVEEGQMRPYFCELSNQCANQMMNDLWDAGIRPTNARDIESELDATKRHLKYAEEMTKKLLDFVTVVLGVDILGEQEREETT